MGYHVSVCLSVALFLVYMVTHGAYQVNCVDLFVCMSVDMESHGIRSNPVGANGITWNPMES